eukprot:15433577-Alexandrium_andersonii.AAC.1
MDRTESTDGAEEDGGRTDRTEYLPDAARGRDRSGPGGRKGPFWHGVGGSRESPFGCRPDKPEARHE